MDDRPGSYEKPKAGNERHAKGDKSTKRQAGENDADAETGNGKKHEIHDEIIQANASHIHTNNNRIRVAEELLHCIRKPRSIFRANMDMDIHNIFTGAKHCDKKDIKGSLR